MADALASRSAGVRPARRAAPAPAPGPRTPKVRRAASLAGEIVILVREPGRRRNGVSRHVEVARVVPASPPADTIRLVLSSGRRLTVPASWWQEVRGELRDLVRDELAPLDAAARETVLAELPAAAAAMGCHSRELSEALHAIREVLRERLPRASVDERRPVGLSVEQILAVDDSSFWISGWVNDGDGHGSVTLVAPEGARVPILQGAFRYERPDVVQFYSALDGGRGEHGFTSFFETGAPSLLARGWIAELRTTDGAELEVQCPPAVRDPQAVRAAILGELGSRRPIGGELTAAHGRHALTRLQRRIVSESTIVSVDRYGAPPRRPETSIVVPLYKRLDLIEHQLLHFHTDPDLAAAELIYVLDSVEQADELAAVARELFALYRMPFTVVNLSSGAGFAGASNHGAAVAAARRLLLLNSDVIPDRPGWLSVMSRFYDATDGIGALGPKLLYEDDSLQHAGLYFHRSPGSELWENAHCFKGLHRSFPAANVAREVPAVTAACMMVDRDRFEAVGGLPVHYVQGDYEDSELCLRLLERGWRSWYLPAVELYHLEAQSYLPGIRRVPSAYNMWLHSSLWGEQIELAMASFDPHAAASGLNGGAPAWPS